MATETWNANAFSPILMTELQRKGGLMETVMVDSGLNDAEYEFRDTIGKLDLKQKQGRLQDTAWEEITKYRRRIMREEFTKSVILDKFDKLNWKVDPTSAIPQELAMGAKRTIDDLIITNMIADVMTGQAGGTTTPFDANNVVAHDSSNITKAKIIEARKILRANYVDFSEELYMVIGSEQEAAMLAIDEFISADYIASKPMVNGQIGTALGLNVVINEGLAVSSSIRKCLVYPKSAFQLLVADEFKTRMDEVQTKEYAPGFSASLAIGGLRMYEGKVAQILCDES
jgi:hypothetical protein